MKSTIHVITPITTTGFRTEEDFNACERSDLKVTNSLLERGPASIESEFDEALAIPDTIRLAIEAERDGADAIVIDCMGDPGLASCREAVSIPVLGPCQTACHTAAMLGHRFSFITVLERLRPMLDHIVGGYGLAGSYAAFEAVDVPVLDICHDVDKLGGLLAEKAIKTVREDHAGAVVLGCTGFMGLAEVIAGTLSEEGLEVPVIDAIPLTIRVADSLVKTGLTHSKFIYPRPEKKAITGYPMPDLWD
ncbi:aspartate/glutamate racemase family protein [Elongatibacter sediminis]|uniref:Aspartate/glutamate racemase family protein n=1 Tax=Elongatibacter sediminis TaxID=3119006 RepID=A0AAW9R8B7_9GAMM